MASMSTIDEASSALLALHGYKIGDCPTTIGWLVEDVLTHSNQYSSFIDVRYRRSDKRRPKKAAAPNSVGLLSPQLMASVRISFIGFSRSSDLTPITQPPSMSPPNLSPRVLSPTNWSPFDSPSSFLCMLLIIALFFVFLRKKIHYVPCLAISIDVQVTATTWSTAVGDVQ